MPRLRLKALVIVLLVTQNIEGGDFNIKQERRQFYWQSLLILDEPSTQFPLRCKYGWANSSNAQPFVYAELL